MNSWIQHVKQVQNEYGVSYKDALKLASKTYNGGSIASEKIKNFIYKKGFNANKMRNPSKYITTGKYLNKTKKPKKNYKSYEELRRLELEDALELDRVDKEFEKLYRKNKKIMGGGAFLNPLMGKVNLKKGGKIRGKGFNWNNVLKTVDFAGHTAGNVVSTALGKELGIPVPNSYDLGRQTGEQLGTAMRKQIKGY